MGEKRKRFQLGLLPIVVCAGLIRFPLNFGPKIFLLRADDLYRSDVVSIHKPLVRIADNSPQLVADVLLWSYRVCDAPDPCA